MTGTQFRTEVKAFILLIIPCIFLLLEPALAETLDGVTNPRIASNEWVSDMANVLNPDARHRLNGIIDQLEKNTTAEMAVVTVNSTDGSVPKVFATDLFKKWGIGKRDKDNGVLVLLVMDARRIEVETGYGVEGVLPDGKVGEILDKNVIPHFKTGDFAGGLLEGVEAMAGVISKPERPGPDSSAGSTHVSVGSGTGGSSTGVNLLVAISGTLLVLFFIGFFWWKSSIRHCPGCKRKMRKLKEDQDDTYLSQVECLEEELGSVNYRVWRCDDCQIITQNQRRSWFTSYKKCPECGYRTVREESITLVEPTYHREGTEEIKHQCLYPKCKYHSVSKRAISRLTPPDEDHSSSSGGGWSFGGESSGGSSSGGGSFGGGSSGGGGAGRSW